MRARPRTSIAVSSRSFARDQVGERTRYTASGRHAWYRAVLGPARSRWSSPMRKSGGKQVPKLRSASSAVAARGVLVAHAPPPAPPTPPGACGRTGLSRRVASALSVYSSSNRTLRRMQTSAYLKCELICIKTSGAVSAALLAFAWIDLPA